MKPKAYDRFCRSWAIIPLMAAIVMLSSCARHGPSNNISSSAFDSASPEVKKLWTDGMSAWKSAHYQDAAKNFISLRGKTDSLSPQQKDELAKAVDEFGQQAFTAADKGDASATQAVMALKDGTGRRSGSAQ